MAKVVSVVHCLREKSGLVISDPDEYGTFSYTSMTPSRQMVGRTAFEQKIKAADRACKQAS